MAYTYAQFKEYQDYCWLYQRYANQLLSTYTIAREVGVNHRTIKYWLEKNSIRIRGKEEANQISNYNQGRVREKSKNWRGGRLDCRKDGYIMIYHKRLPSRTYYKLEHVLIAERALGRLLKKGEVVHHINMDPKDNRNSNLLICTAGYHKWLEFQYAKAFARNLGV